VTYVEQYTDGVSATDGVLVLLQVVAECYWVHLLYEVHALAATDRFM